MPRVKITTEALERPSVDIEIARLRDLDVEALRARWEAAVGKKAPAHLPRHLLFRMVAYRLQAERLGDLHADSRRILDRSGSPEQASSRAADANRRANNVRPGTVLGREWNGRMHRVTVMADGFAWNGATYPSLSKVAFAITGTRWNGPKFFGLRDSVRVKGGARS
jgi:hypothetical protein